MEYQLAQLNIARMKFTLEGPEMRDFVEALDPVNALAEASPGFVWRLKDDEGDATSFRIFEDDRSIVNMSVWESPGDLKRFITLPGHLAIMRRRGEWFEKLEEATTVLWWVPGGHRPDLQEAIERLGHLREHGPCNFAFSFAEPFDPPGPV